KLPYTPPTSTLSPYTTLFRSSDTDMDLGLKNKVALVAAASRGLGRAVAEELAAEGASLLLCSRSEEAINKVANEIAQATSAKVLAVAADVSKADEIARLTRFGAERLGRIDIL